MSNTPNVRSLSGKQVGLECAIFVNPFLVEQRRHLEGNCQEFNFFACFCPQEPRLNIEHSAPNWETMVVPDGHRAGGIRPEDYEAYRKGLDSACVDVVITTAIPREGSPMLAAVLAIKRKHGTCFGDKWWIMGGAIHSYRPITDFIKERATKECGVTPRLEGLIGVFRTAAPDALACTTNICLVGHVDYKNVAQKFKADYAHGAHRLLTLEDLEKLPEAEKHWYPMFCFRRALETVIRGGFSGPW